MTLFFQQDQYLYELPQKYTDVTPSWVRAGIISGWLPIGTATRDGKKITDLKEMNSKFGRINFYISPKALYEQTGFLWRGKDGTR